MENKKPMSLAKKEFISWIIWLIAGILFAAAGGVMTSITNGNRTIWIVCGAIMLACGVAIIILSIVKLIPATKKYQQEKAH